MSRSQESTSTSDEIASLRDEIRLLRQVLDEVRSELFWANNNAQDFSPDAGATSAFKRITSMSLDPVARDFQVNSVDEKTMAQLRDDDATTTREASSQRSLF